MVKIDQYLKDLGGSELIFKPNRGNAGDAMINLATYQAFRRCGCNFRMATAEEDLTGKTLLYGGGGNLVSYYSTASDFIAQWHGKAARFILLPHTVSGHEGLLRQLGENVDLICREEVSYQYVRGLKPRCNILLMDDMAFSLDLGKLNIGLTENAAPGKDTGFMAALARRYLGFEERKPKKLNAFRVDKESTGIEIPNDNIDVARLVVTGDMAETKTKDAVTLLLRFINHYDEINTNRLHICISGLLLGKKVNFYPNSYYKNEAVYNFSMKDKRELITWKG